MIDVVVAIDDNSKNVYYLSSNSLNLKINDNIVFEIDGSEFVGRVTKEKYLEKKENLVLPLNKVLRKVNNADLKRISNNKRLAEKALNDAKKLSKELNLDMNFIDAYFFLDNSQLIFYFLSDTRVDFRDLVKKLAQKYKTRIELRQIGVRDKAKKIGGIGPCGLFLCCNTFLTDFNSVSINMAKNQMLALNPSKINGICGRLLCCLGYENETYTELKKDFPKLGNVIKTSQGLGKVVNIDVFNKKYSVDLKEKGIITFSLGDNDGEA